MVTRYLFLDGGCLRARVNDIARRYCEGAPLKLNWWSLAAGYDKIFYYDALPTRKPNQSEEDFETERQEVENLHAKLATFDRFRVNEGDTRYRKGRGLEQKKVDVMIAVDMMIHTIRRNMTAASLLAGDADFTPLLNALSNEGMFVTLIHPPKASKDLLAAADARRAITSKQVYDWLDTPSQARFGSFPVPSYDDTSHNENCQHIWSDDLLGIEVWCQLIDDTIWASWPAPELNGRLCLTRGNWKHTRLVALDDYGVDLPIELPPEFKHL
ncbi:MULTISPECIES: NYN domain-containing protein [Rhizobium]|jgi:uncharacterized LabA/DUF88 family protein|nr:MULTISPECIES: NYN domain-containing protein [Rhizobium]NEJ06241.1 NYN domain-containing protein [Rhizobium ruizarguesonis]QIO58750.1 NYN domain-containing protein [Rhizobium leguminosarum bv. trifolii]TBA14688.1 NYN domain-containing protein [Rhizobium ruizarguesonis]